MLFLFPIKIENRKNSFIEALNKKKNLSPLMSIFFNTATTGYLVVSIKIFWLSKKGIYLLKYP